jgi:hypothetical protein
LVPFFCFLIGVLLGLLLSIAFVAFVVLFPVVVPTGDDDDDGFAAVVLFLPLVSVVENKAPCFRNRSEIIEASVFVDIVIVVDDDILGVRDEKEKARATPFPEFLECAAP